MEGFFSKKETESSTRPDGKTYSCVSCGLLKACETPKFKPVGDFEKGILNIFAFPTDIEDNRGKAFSSKEANLLKKNYAKLGIDLHKDCLNTYAIKCSPDENPTPYQIDSCRKFLLKLIQEYKPKVIVLFGDIPLQSLIGYRWKKDLGKIEKWRGWKIPDQDLQTWIVPTFSADYITSANEGVEEVIWQQDLEGVTKLLTTPFKRYKEPEIVDISDDLSILDSIKSGNIAFDYETTGLKPHAEGHKIVCVSVAVSEDKVYTFMMPTSRRAQKPFRGLIKRETVGKIAQNMKYEDNWTNELLKIPVTKWVWDTMLATHIIDNRVGVTGLKFQTYVQLGVIDYDSEINPYLKAIDDKNANSLNRILELLEKPDGKEKLLKYCAYDSINEIRLANWQRKHMAGTQGLTEVSPINSDFPNAYRLLHDGILAFAKAERQGLRIDLKYAQRKDRFLTNQIETLETEFKATQLYKHWAHTAKGKPNLNSGDQLGRFLYNTKKITPLKLTETGKGSTDEEALSLLKIPELDLILKRNKLKKLKDTYLSAFVREQVDGFMHPFFNLNTVMTYRSSSSNPNFQNVPKRDESAMKIVRKAIYPRVGHQLLELDYSGIEVAIAACYHKDPQMIKYITDPKSDMHGDMAKQIFKMDNFDRHIKTHAMLRGAAKNSFVFPQFYGDYYKMNAIAICSTWVQLPQTKWNKSMGVEISEGYTIGEHFINQGIKSFNDFLEHMKTIEHDFWSNRFKVYAKWKESHYKEYQKDVYVTLKTGFVCKGVMRKNAAINYPIQGAAFHCLLWCFIELTKAMEKLGMDSKIVGQIHDAVVLDVHPDELQQVYDLVQQIGTKDLIKAFKWINVPLSIDAELCGVDESWAEKKEWKPNN